MGKGIRWLLAPPVFEGDEDKTRMAMLLNTILFLLLARALLFRGLSFFEDATQAPRPGLFVPLTVLLTGMIFLMRRGYVQMASVITVIGFWLSLSVIAVINGGIRSTGFRNYIIPVLIAGLLLGRWATMSVAALSILAGLVMWQAEISGLMPVLLVPGTSLELLITHAISLLIAAVLVTLATRSIMDALDLARQEVVERRQAEEAARASENLWRTIFNDAAVGIALVDKSGRPVESNPALQRLLGYTEEELRSMSFVEFTHPDDVDADTSLYRELMEDRRDYYQMEKRYVRKDGQAVWGNLIVSIIRDEHGLGQFAVGMVEDITHRKRAEEENQTLLHDLGERVKELTALHGAARILQKEGADTSEVLREMASLLPPAFQYPEVTAARIRLGQTEAMTPDFTDSAPTLRAEFTTADGKSGSIDVVYNEDCPPEFEGPFLIEERALINTLADMLRTSYDRKQAEEQLRATSEQLRALTRSLNSAREEEGIRIAREIHDELGSAMTSLRWELESCDKILSEPPDRLQPQSMREKIAAMIRLTDATINTIRRISSELRPSVLDDLGLAEAIEWQAQQFQSRTGIICRCDCALDSLDLDGERSTALFRIFQETLTNVLRHAQATRVDIRIEAENGELILTISDNGVGITESQKSASRSLGLLGMRERAHLVGGEIQITGIAGKGTAVTVRVPTQVL